MKKHLHFLLSIVVLCLLNLNNATAQNNSYVAYKRFWDNKKDWKRYMDSLKMEKRKEKNSKL